MNSFTKTTSLLQRAMDVASLRYQVSANNLANVEVPNFKKQKVNFETELKKALENNKNVSSLKMKATDPRHFQNDNKIDWQTIKPRRVTDWESTAKANGNNVDVEEEAMNILKLGMSYNLLARLSDHEFSQMKIAMDR